MIFSGEVGSGRMAFKFICLKECMITSPLCQLKMLIKSVIHSFSTTRNMFGLFCQYISISNFSILFFNDNSILAVSDSLKILSPVIPATFSMYSLCCKDLIP